MSVLNQFPGEIVSHTGKHGLTRDERLMSIGDHAVALVELIDGLPEDTDIKGSAWQSLGDIMRGAKVVASSSTFKR